MNLTAETNKTKPLYLEGSKPCRVSLDGPALKLDVQAQAPVRVPFKRLSRVISDYRVQWEPGALYKCLENGVAISICAANGDAVGIVLPLANKRTLLAQEIEIFRTYADWTSRYEIWRLAAERRAVLSANKVLRLNMKELTTDKVRKAVDQRLCKLFSDEDPQMIGDRIHGYLSGLVAEALRQRGVAVSILRLPTRGINLYADLIKIIEWDCKTILHTAYLSAQRKNVTPTPAFVAEVVERNGDYIRERADYYINLLEEVVLDVNHGTNW